MQEHSKPYKPRHTAPEPPQASAVATVTTANDASRGRREKAEADRATRLSAARVRARDEMRLAVIARSRGPKAAERVYESPSWSKLKANLNDLEARGLDDRAMLHLAARKGDFEGARDYAAVLSGRLDDVRRSHSIPRTRPEPAERGPAVDYLVGPADRGPARPSLPDADTMHDLTRAAGPRGNDPMARPDYEPRHAGRSREGQHQDDYAPRHAAQSRQGGSDGWLEKYRADYARRLAETEQSRTEEASRDRGMDIGF